MTRRVGTVACGIRCKVIKAHDDLTEIVTEAVMAAAKEFPLHEHDIVAVTESVVARAQDNYVTVAEIAEEIKKKTTSEKIGLVFPILSRNRFALCLRAFARAFKEVIVALSYPRDEVGNALFDDEALVESKIDPYHDCLGLKEYRDLFGYPKHRFTGIDYVEYYQKLIEEEGAKARFIFTNQASSILKYTDTVLCCDIHSRNKTAALLRKSGAKQVLTLADIMKEPSLTHGYNQEYGLLGSNKADEERIKLFPRDCQKLVTEIQAKLFKQSGKKLEVMIYGDGAFKDPVGEIWELADPVVSPAYTDGLKGRPQEVKLKYLADQEFANLRDEELADAIKNKIKHKKLQAHDAMESEGTTPRQISDLVGSLADLVSGSGDKGTPIVLIQGYFDNYSD